MCELASVATARAWRIEETSQEMVVPRKLRQTREEKGSLPLPLPLPHPPNPIPWPPSCVLPSRLFVNIVWVIGMFVFMYCFVPIPVNFQAVFVYEFQIDLRSAVITASVIIIFVQFEVHRERVVQF